MYLSDYKSLKNRKKGFLYALTRAELTWHNVDTWRSHEGRHEPSWAPTWREDANKAKSIGPTGIVVPSKRIGGHTRLVRATQRP